MVSLKGKLVTLEPLDVNKHAQGYFELSQDITIHQYTGNTVPKAIAETVALLKKYENYFINWIIIANETNTVIGIIRLSKPEIANGTLIAGESQFLSSKYWRKGHMKETKQLFYQYVFDVLAVQTLYADVWEGNLNSIKSLEYYGYKLIETTEELFTKTGTLTKKYIYALRSEDYRCRPMPPSDEGGGKNL